MQHLPVIVQNIYMVFLEFVYSFGSHIIYNNGKLRNNLMFNFLENSFSFLFWKFSKNFGAKKLQLKIFCTSESRWISVSSGHDAKRLTEGATRAEAGPERGRDELSALWCQQGLDWSHAGRYISIKQSEELRIKRNVFWGVLLLEKLESVMRHFYF